MPETNLLDERQLMEDYARGDPAAVRTVDGWIDAALRNGFYSLRTEWADLRQEVRTRLLSNLQQDRFAGRSTLKTYVSRIVRNACIDMRRRAGHRREEPLGSPDAPPPTLQSRSALPAHMARDLVDKLLGGLTEGERLLVEMVFGENCSYTEVASQLGISEAAVKTRVFRCKTRIVNQYERLARRGR